MQDLICPNCEKIVPYEPKSNAYICKYCGWVQEQFPGAILMELKRENFRLKERIQELEAKEADEITLRIGDIRYCLYSGGANDRAAVLKSELYRITINHLKTTYSFKPLETDHPNHLSYSGEIYKRTFKDKEAAEKSLRKFLSKRRHKDGRIRPLKSQKQIAAENRAKYEAEYDESEDECL